jgi:hypothetical protein
MRSCGALIFVAFLAAPAGAAQVRLSGKVVSDTNVPLGNATVSVRAQPPASGAIRAITSASGAFSIDLPHAGDYLVDVECSGFFTLSDRTVSVLDSGTELTLVLNPVREYSESVQVSPRTSPVDLDQNGSAKTLSGAELLNVPYADSPGLKDSLPTLPGIVQDAFGGIHLNGAGQNQVLYTLDGFNIGDPLSGRFDPPVSVEAVRSIKTLSGAFSSEYGRGSAGVIEVVTNTGDDTFHDSATNFLPVVVNQKGLRIAGWNPRFSLSGPLARGRAWFMNNFIPHYGQSVVPELPSGQDTSTDTRFSDYFHAQINIMPSNILYGGILGSRSSASRSGLSALDPPPTTVDVGSGQWFFSVRDQQFFTAGSVLELGYASNHTSLRLTPQGHNPYISSPTGRSGNYYLDGSQHSSRDQVIMNLYLPTFGFAGAHQMKTGIDLERIGFDQDITRSGIAFLDSRQQEIRSIFYGGNGSLSKSNWEAASYVQDNWRVHRSLLLQVGARLDWDRILHDWSASPRLNAGWSPRGMENTKVSGGYAITRNEIDLRLFVRPEDQYPISRFFPPYGSGNQDVRSIFVIPDQHLSNPRYETWNVTLDHRWPANLDMRIEGLRRRTSNALAYAGTPHTQADSIYTLANGRTESYSLAEISFRQTFGKEYGWLAGYVRSSTHSSAVFDAAADDYFIAANSAGPRGWDAPNRVVSWAYLPTFRRKWAVSYFLEYHTGLPFSASNNAGIIVGPVNSYRFPDYFNLNLDIERRIRFASNLWALRIGCDNITNHFNPSGVNGIIESSQFGQFNGGKRRALTLRIRWLGKP